MPFELFDKVSDILLSWFSICRWSVIVSLLFRGMMWFRTLLISALFCLMGDNDAGLVGELLPVALLEGKC